MINHPNRNKSAAETVIDISIAKKVLEVVDAGLSSGVGNPIPGQMCVEAAVCYALGLPHGDDPACVSRALRSLKIKLNDSRWSSDQARAKGLRRLALIQLGSRDHLDDKEFVRRVADLAIRKQVPIALRAAASIHKDAAHMDVAASMTGRMDSVRWIETFAGGYDCSYEEMISAAKAYRDHGDYFGKGGTFEGECVPDEFWTHFERVTGDVVPDSGRGSFFTCSC